MAHDLWIPFLATIFGNIAYTPDRLVLYRQQGSNTMGASPFQIELNSNANKLSSKVQADNFLLLSTLSPERAGFLCALFSSSQQNYTSGLRAAYIRYVCHARFLYLRSLMYSSNTFKLKFLAYVRLVLSSSYSGTQSGGLGFRAFIKDAKYLVSGQ
jgi:hypothetical protein